MYTLQFKENVPAIINQISEQSIGVNDFNFTSHHECDIGSPSKMVGILVREDEPYSGKNEPVYIPYHIKNINDIPEPIMFDPHKRLYDAVKVLLLHIQTEAIETALDASDLPFNATVNPKLRKAG